MDRILLLPFFLQSLPESFIIMALGLTLVGVFPRFKILIAIAVAATFFSYVMRSLPLVFGIHSLLQLFFLTLAVILFFKLTLIQAAIAVLLGSIALGLAESIFIPIILRILNISLQDFLASPWLRVIVPLPHTLILAYTAWFSLKHGWVLIPYQKVNREKQNKYQSVSLLIIISLVQGFLFILINLAFYSYSAGFFLTMKLELLFWLSSAILFAATATTIVVSYHMLQVSRKEAQIDAEYRHLQDLQKIYLSFRTQRHDFINHVMSIYGLLKVNQVAAASEYMENLYSEVRKNKTLLDVGIPGLSGLLQAKSLTADERGIRFDISADPGFAEIPMKQVDLTGIVGNLLDNAIDAVLENTDTDPYIYLELTHNAEGFTIAVTNSGYPIAPDMKEKIFKDGFTTKNRNGHAGLGLFTVNNIIRKYKGSIKIDEPDNFKGTRFCVLIPHTTREEVANHGVKSTAG